MSPWGVRTVESSTVHEEARKTVGHSRLQNVRGGESVHLGGGFLEVLRRDQDRHAETLCGGGADDVVGEDEESRDRGHLIGERTEAASLVELGGDPQGAECERGEKRNGEHDGELARQPPV